MGESERRRVRLVRIGGNQALRIPPELEFEGEEVILRSEGDRLIVEPVRKRRLFPLLRKLGALEEPPPAVDDDSTPQ